MNNITPWRQAILTGIIISLFGPAFFHIADHQHTSINPMTIRGISGLVGLVILGIGMYSATQSVKRQQAGSLTYKQAITSGIFVALITAIIVSVFTLIYCNYINPNYADYMVAAGKRQMVADGESATAITTHVKDLQKQYSTPMQVMQSFVGQLLSGTIISLIMGLFIKTKNQIN